MAPATVNTPGQLMVAGDSSGTTAKEPGLAKVWPRLGTFEKFSDSEKKTVEFTWRVFLGSSGIIPFCIDLVMSIALSLILYHLNSAGTNALSSLKSLFLPHLL